MNNGTQNIDNRENGQITIGACYKLFFSFFRYEITLKTSFKRKENGNFHFPLLSISYGNKSVLIYILCIGLLINKANGNDIQ